MKLSNIQRGVPAIVTKIEDGVYTQKLLTLGFLEDVEVCIIRKSPFGDSYLVRVAAQFVALRTKELESIITKSK